MIQRLFFGAQVATLCKNFLFPEVIIFWTLGSNNMQPKNLVESALVDDHQPTYLTHKFEENQSDCHIVIMAFNALSMTSIRMRNIQHTRVIHKVRKTQHQNPEFGHTRGEIKKKKKDPAKKNISIQRGKPKKTINFCDKLSFILSFLFS